MKGVIVTIIALFVLTLGVAEPVLAETFRTTATEIVVRSYPQGSAGFVDSKSVIDGVLDGYGAVALSRDPRRSDPFQGEYVYSGSFSYADSNGGHQFSVLVYFLPVAGLGEPFQYAYCYSYKKVSENAALGYITYTTPWYYETAQCSQISEWVNGRFNYSACFYDLVFDVSLEGHVDDASDGDGDGGDGGDDDEDGDKEDGDEDDEDGDGDGDEEEGCTCGAGCEHCCTCGKWDMIINGGGHECSGMRPIDHFCHGEGHGSPPNETFCCDCHDPDKGGDGGEEDEEEEEDDVEDPGDVHGGGLEDGELPDGEVEIKQVEIPDRIKERFSDLWENFQGKLGLKEFGDMFQFKPGEMGKFCITNPLKHFCGVAVPQWTACLDFEELAQESWVPLLRIFLLFMVVCMFVSAIVVVFRQY